MRRGWWDRPLFTLGPRSLTVIVLLTFLLAGFFVGRATADSLTARGRQANLYGGLMGTGRACFDLRPKKPTRVEVAVTGARVWADGMEDTGGSWAEREQFRLRPGHRHFCRSYTLRYWELVPALQLRWRALEINAVHAELSVGIYPGWHSDPKGVRVYKKTTLLRGERPFDG